MKQKSIWPDTHFIFFNIYTIINYQNSLLSKFSLTFGIYNLYLTQFNPHTSCHRKEWVKLYLHFPHMPSWSEQGQLYLVLPFLFIQRWIKSKVNLPVEALQVMHCET
jgi:hypothetical protein